jgi:enoyl-CoA hydratase
MRTHVDFARDADVGYLTLVCDEAGKPATLDLDTLAELEAHVQQIHSDPGALRAIVLQSDSPKYFVVGANVHALETLDAETIVPWIERGHAVYDQLEALPLPTIARIEGYALGGGLELAMACDLIVASPGARFGQPEANLGFVAGWGGTYRLPRRVGLSKAKELFFTARIIDAREALAAGLVDFCGERAELDAYITSLVDDIRQLSPFAVSQMKRLVNLSPDIDLRQNCLEETVASRLCLSTGDTKERIRAFLDGRRKKQTGSV